MEQLRATVDETNRRLQYTNDHLQSKAKELQDFERNNTEMILQIGLL
jgi:hypothetical protein